MVPLESSLDAYDLFLIVEVDLLHPVAVEKCDVVGFYVNLELCYQFGSSAGTTDRTQPTARGHLVLWGMVHVVHERQRRLGIVDSAYLHHIVNGGSGVVVESSRVVVLMRRQAQLRIVGIVEPGIVAPRHIFQAVRPVIHGTRLVQNEVVGDGYEVRSGTTIGSRSPQLLYL